MMLPDYWLERPSANTAPGAEPAFDELLQSTLGVGGCPVIPYALPALFAAARIAVPAAIGGATLAEWLSTGTGMGNLLVLSFSASRFGTLWAASVVIVGLSVAFYATIGVLEAAILRRYGTALPA